LDSSGCEKWKEKALKAIQEAEAIIIFDRKSCEESDNAKWEINKAMNKLMRFFIQQINNNIHKYHIKKHTT
jgi:mRNA degradation ribonuclease J1/J2